mmetsp:Transcript_25083/g.82725  ORF Transcript_25083/g.82725 Transcript_25083/m.82725 type:complete len:453 (-) Transcript_25083:1237-2595(-)
MTKMCLDTCEDMSDSLIPDYLMELDKESNSEYLRNLVHFSPQNEEADTKDLDKQQDGKPEEEELASAPAARAMKKHEAVRHDLRERRTVQRWKMYVSSCNPKREIFWGSQEAFSEVSQKELRESEKVSEKTKKANESTSCSHMSSGLPSDLWTIARFLNEMRTASLLLGLTCKLFDKSCYSSKLPTKGSKSPAPSQRKRAAQFSSEEHLSSERNLVALMEQSKALQDLVQENSLSDGSILRLTGSGMSQHVRIMQRGRSIEIVGGMTQPFVNLNRLLREVFHTELSPCVALTMLEYKNASSNRWQKVLDIPKIRKSLSSHQYNLLVQSAQSFKVENGGFRSYHDAAELVRSLELKDRRQWTCWAESPARPLNIPSRPWEVYQDSWTSLGEFLGVKAAPRKRRVPCAHDGSRSKFQCADGRVKKSSSKMMRSIQGDLQDFHSSLDQLSVGLAG